MAAKWITSSIFTATFLRVRHSSSSASTSASTSSAIKDIPMFAQISSAMERVGLTSSTSNDHGPNRDQKPILHRGTSFTNPERTSMKIRGTVPTAVETLDQQIHRAKHQLSHLPSPLLKHIYLNTLRRENKDLFYGLMMEGLGELTPIVYTPTVGEACQKFSSMVYGGGEAEGLFLSIEDKGSLHTIISTYAHAHPHLYASSSTATPAITVVTDGSRILGLGDLGIGGIGISIGKLCLYVLGGGVRADGVIPVVLDMGTNNQSLLDDPMYLGLRRTRPSLEEATEFMDEFMQTMTDLFPGIIIQHEDFESEKAFHFLDRYQHKYAMFNDDIQGTGSVIFSGFTNAARFSCAASGKTAQDHKVVFLGGGSAAVGVAKQMMTYFTLNGLTEQEARERFWLVDTKGLITADRYDTVAGKLAKHKEYFVRRDNAGQQFKTLEEVIEYVKPTALVGLSTTKDAFTEKMVRRMAELNGAPIIFPLSNPTSKCELAFEDALNWTDGRVLYASGSPYDPVEYGGKLREAGQGNNFLVFPGIGLGALFCGATRITDDMITTSGLALADALDPSEKADSLLYPRLSSDRIRQVSAEIALKVVRQAQKEGVDSQHEYRSMSDSDLQDLIQERQWTPSSASQVTTTSKL